MAENVVPTLSPSGWVRSPSEKLDRIFAYFFEAQYSQSAIYDNAIYSLQYLVEEYGKDEYRLAEQIKNTLLIYLGKYFDSVNLDTRAEKNESNEITISIYATVMQNNQEYSVGKMLSVFGNKITKIIAMNN